MKVIVDPPFASYSEEELEEKFKKTDEYADDIEDAYNESMDEIADLINSYAKQNKSQKAKVDNVFTLNLAGREVKIDMSSDANKVQVKNNGEWLTVKPSSNDE